MNCKEIQDMIKNPMDFETNIYLIQLIQTLISKDLKKAISHKIKKGKYPKAALFRVRMYLVFLEKVGLQYRKLTVEMEK